MRRFRFRLEGLLRVRSRVERIAQRAVAEAMGEVTRVQQCMDSATAGLRDCEDQACGNGPESLLARALADGLRRHHMRLETELSGAEARLDRARTDWLESRRQHRVIEQLRERRHEEWRVDAERSEQREIEELAKLRNPEEGWVKEVGK